MKHLIGKTAAILLLVLASVASAVPAEDAGKEKKPADDASGPARFYGTITKVDDEAKTFTIDDKVYSVVGETKMTNKEGKDATLKDAVVGEPARGTYTKSSDGTMIVTKVRFGKKSGGAGGSGGGGKGKKKEKEKKEEAPAESAK